jgi:DNA-binding protein HU-beta
MAKALSKAQLVAAIAEKAELPKKQTAEILDHIAELAYTHAKDTFTLPGIGKLVLNNRAARVGRNPKTGESINIPAKRVVKFRVAKAAKDAILGAK